MSEVLRGLFLTLQCDVFEGMSARFVEAEFCLVMVWFYGRPCWVLLLIPAVNHQK